MSTPDHTPPNSTPLENALSARMRLIQRKLVGWTEERWTQAIVEATGGALAPARYRLKGADEWSGPVPYLATNKLQTSGLVLSRQGLLRIRHHSTDTHEWSISSAWDSLPQTAADATQVQSLMGSEPITADYIFRIEPFNVMAPVVYRLGASVKRFPIQDWNVVANDPSTIPDFPDQATMLSWLQRALSDIPNIHGPSFFSLLAECPALSKWLQHDCDWQALTQSIKPRSVADLDASRLPDVKHVWFLEWLEAVSTEYMNVRTLLPHYQAGMVPKTESGKRLLDAFSSWTSGETSALARQENKITTNALVVFCSASFPPPATRDWLEKTLAQRRFEEDGHDVVEMAKFLSHELPTAPPAWVRLMAQHIDRNNIEKIVTETVSNQWRQQLLLATGSGDLDALPSFKFFVLFRQSLLDTPENERSDFLCALLANRAAMRSPTSEASFVESMREACALAWPEQQSYFNTISDLESDFRLWPALLRDHLSLPSVLATLPDLEAAPG